MIRRLTDALFSALLAPPCAVCDRILDRPLAGAVCERCWEAIVPYNGDAVLRRPASAKASAVRRSFSEGGSFNSGAISLAAAIGEYDGVLREIIHAFKYQGRRSTAPRLAALMAHHGAHVLAGADAVVPVPLHPRRERERGFNQADDLARALGLPVSRVLRRVRSTQPQVDLPAAQRHGNVNNAFDLAFATAETPRGKTIVLVDDVTTTGATLEACARVVTRAGAAEVRALTAARVASAPR